MVWLADVNEPPEYWASA